MNLGLWITNGHYSPLDFSAYVGGFHPPMFLLLCYLWSIALEGGRDNSMCPLPWELPTAGTQGGPHPFAGSTPCGGIVGCSCVL